MRPDMAKVIVERPRYGSRLKARHKKGYRRYVQRHGDELPRREPMMGRWRGRQRSLNEHLGPMRRFLRSRVGRPWDKIYQELCQHVALDNAVQNHVLSHIFQYVARRVEVHGGRLVHAEGYWRGQPLRAGHLYVCPESGLLKAARPPKRRGPPPRLYASQAKELLSSERWLWELDQAGHGIQYHRRENCWWQVRVRKLPADLRDRWDVWLERPVAQTTKADRRIAYGGEVFAISKRPLSMNEARELHRSLRTT